MAVNVIVKSFIQGFSGGIHHNLGYNRVHLYKQENRYNIFFGAFVVCLLVFSIIKKCVFIQKLL